MGYVGSYIWELRQTVGQRLIVTPAAVVVVLDAEDRVLLTERTDTGHWCLPGGSAEPGQTFVATAIDELREEAGLAVAAEQLTAFGSLSDDRWTHFTFPNGDELHSFNLCFVVREWEGAARANGSESASVGFFARDHLPDPMLPMSERVLDLFDAWAQTGAFQAS